MYKVHCRCSCTLLRHLLKNLVVLYLILNSLDSIQINPRTGRTIILIEAFGVHADYKTLHLQRRLCNDVSNINVKDHNRNDDDIMASIISDVISNVTTDESNTIQTSSTKQHNNNEEYWINVGSAITEEVIPLIGKVKSLGIDYGLARTGIAMTVGYEPTPLTIIQSSLYNYNTTLICNEIIQYVTRYQIQQIIVGLPLHKNGTIAEQTNKTLSFTKLLAKQVLCQLGPKVPILLFDERYTSKMAAAREHMKYPSSALYGTLDATAACIILENYYEDCGIGAYRVQIEPEVIRQQYVQQYYTAQQTLEDNKKIQYQNEMNQRMRRIQMIEQSKLQDQLQQQQVLSSSNDMDTDKPKRPKKKKKKK